MHYDNGIKNNQKKWHEKKRDYSSLLTLEASHPALLKHDFFVQSLDDRNIDLFFHHALVMVRSPVPDRRSDKDRPGHL